MIPQSYFRYEPISLSYDPNEFAHFYNKKSHQNFANFDRPEKGRINEFLTLSSRLATARRDLASNSDKKPKKRRTFAKKNRLKNREIRKNRINLLLFTFENRRKIKEKSALFGGPYRNSDRQFFYSPKILDFCCLYLSSKCIKKTSWFMPYSGIHYVSLPVIFAQNSVF